MAGPDSFTFGGHWRWGDPQRASLRALYAGSNWLYQAGTETLDTLDVIEAAGFDSYVPANGAIYPNGSFGEQPQDHRPTDQSRPGPARGYHRPGRLGHARNEGDDGGGYLATNQLAPLGQGWPPCTPTSATPPAPRTTPAG